MGEKMKATLPVMFMLIIVILVSSSFNSFGMQIYLEVTTGLQAKEPYWNLIYFPLTLDVESGDSIENVRAKIFDKEPSIDAGRELLLYSGGILEDGKTLSDYSIEKNSTLFLDSSNTIVVPEPTTYLLCLSLGVVGLMRRQLRIDS